MRELDYIKLGMRIRQVRKVRGWSQDVLAKKCGISMYEGRAFAGGGYGGCDASKRRIWGRCAGLYGGAGVGSGGEGDSGLYGGCEPDGLEEVKGNAQGFSDGESIRIFNIVP